MEHNTNEFIEKVKNVAKQYGYEVSSETDGQSVDTDWKVRIDNAGVEVKITAGCCIVTDEEGNSKQFDTSQSEWNQESLGHIETLLQLKPAEHECSS